MTGDEDRIAIQIFLTGKVQGVGFRNAFANAISESDLSGWARNHRYGLVEVFIEGNRDAAVSLSHRVQAGLDRATVKTANVIYTEPYLYLQDDEARKADLSQHRSESFRSTFGAFFDASRFAGKVLLQRFADNRGMRRSGPGPKEFESVPVSMISEKCAQSAFAKIDNFGCSFAAQMWSRTRSRKVIRTLGQKSEAALSNKVMGFHFADAIGLRRPRTIQRDASWQDVEILPGTVIKPHAAAGAKGVYYVFEDGFSEANRPSQDLRQLSELRQELKSFQEATGKTDAYWMVEELILGKDGLPSDCLKMYCFYGETPFGYQNKYYMTEAKHCGWSRTGNMVDTGVYLRSERFEGTRIPVEHFELADRISLEIPAPFMRIDLLDGRDGLVLGEFTPRPGKFERFNTKFDRLLGRHFIEAQERLFLDVSKGKRFEAFEKVTGGRR